jgi:RNA polymerase sigma-70 factor (ECF subfamily)
VSGTTATDTATKDLEQYRGELTGYCYRMLGSAHDADDAVQETMVRAWQAFDRFEGRSALRSWLYRIATNVCLDMLRSRQRRALPMDLSAPVPASTPPVATQPEAAWLEPIPGEAAVPADTDPAGRAVLRDSIRLAFVAALQHLPPRQRAVLILREVLCWQAAEVAQLLDTTVVSVNSALQRARATMAASGQATGEAGEAPAPPASLPEADRELLASYVDAFQRYDMDRLVELLHEDASISMPPYQMWLRGREELRGWYLGFGSGCRGSVMVPVVANGMPAFGQYKPSEDGNGLEPWCIQVPEISGGKISHIHHFLAADTSLFDRFGLPQHLDG